MYRQAQATERVSVRMVGDEAFEQGALTTWVRDRGGRVPRQRGRQQHVDVYRRFAFYGRISTDGYQDADTSREWQRCVQGSSWPGAV